MEFADRFGSNSNSEQVKKEQKKFCRKRGNVIIGPISNFEGKEKDKLTLICQIFTFPLPNTDMHSPLKRWKKSEKTKTRENTKSKYLPRP